MPIFSQIIINSLIAGSIYALIAAGFSLLFNTLKFVDISYGALYVTSAYFALTIAKYLNLPLSIILSIFLTTIFAIILYKIIYYPLRNQAKLSLLLTSFATYTLIEGLILLIFGSSPKSFNLGAEKGIEILGANITKIQILIICLSIILLIILILLMKKTKLGITLRAVSDNKLIAQTLGINLNRITIITITISTILASIAGILSGLDQGLQHTRGLLAILKGFTSSIVGGIGNIPASIIGGFFIGFVENFGILFLPSGFKDAITFIILILFLLLRPQGFFGIKTREEFAG